MSGMRYSYGSIIHKHRCFVNKNMLQSDKFILDFFFKEQSDFFPHKYGKISLIGVIKLMQWYHYVIISLVFLIGIYLYTAYNFYRRVFVSFNKHPKNLVDHTIDFYACAYEWFEKVPKEDVHIHSYDNVKLHGYFIPSLDKNANNLAIVIHGYQSKATDMIIIAKLYSDLGFKILMIDLRGHGESEGKFTSMGYYEKYDLKKWINFATRNNGANIKILLHGVSMGAAMSLMVTELKVKANIKFLVLDSSFTVFSKSFAESIKPKILRMFIPGVSLFTYLFHKFTLSKISPLTAAKHNEIPFLIIHGDKDRPVPLEMGKAIYEASPIKNKNLLIVPGAPHARGFEINKELVIKQIIYNTSDIFGIKKSNIKNCD